MRATFENLVFRFRNTPFKDFARQNPLVVLGSAVALTALSAGVYYAFKALRNKFSHQPAGPAPAVNAAAQAALPAPAPAAPAGPVVNFRPEIRSLLDTLFTGTAYSVDSLPVYPAVIDEKQVVFDPRLVTGSVIKFVTNDNRVGIVLLVNSTCTPEEIYAPGVPQESSGQPIPRIFHRTIILGQFFPYKTNSWESDLLVWGQLNRGGPSSIHPNFFTSNFTQADGKLDDTQASRFGNLRTLLQTGQGQDVQGRVWRLTTRPAS